MSPLGHRLTTNLKASVELPNLNIKHFSVNPLEFQSFLDSFNVAIHENDNISPITKFIIYLFIYLFIYLLFII